MSGFKSHVHADSIHKQNKIFFYFSINLLFLEQGQADIIHRAVCCPTHTKHLHHAYSGTVRSGSNPVMTNVFWVISGHIYGHIHKRNDMTHIYIKLDSTVVPINTNHQEYEDSNVRRKRPLSRSCQMREVVQ